MLEVVEMEGIQLFSGLSNVEKPELGNRWLFCTRQGLRYEFFHRRNDSVVNIQLQRHLLSA